MNTVNIRRSIIRLAGIVAIMTALLMSSGSAAAMYTQVGLAECHYDGCRVVTLDDLPRTTRDAQVVPKRHVSFPFDRAGRRFVP